MSRGEKKSLLPRRRDFSLCAIAFQPPCSGEFSIWRSSLRSRLKMRFFRSPHARAPVRFSRLRTDRPLDYRRSADIYSPRCPDRTDPGKTLSVRGMNSVGYAHLSLPETAHSYMDRSWLPRLQAAHEPGTRYHNGRTTVALRLFENCHEQHPSDISS